MSAAPDLLLNVAGLSASYGSIQALDEVSVTVGRGEVVALLGANGAGKSTLMRTIAGVGPRVTGAITLDGRRIDTWSPAKRVAAGITLVPEGRRLFAPLTVAENIRMGAIGCTNRTKRKQILEEVTEIFPIIRDRADEPAGNLSGGQQQQVALARGLMADPNLLMLDEPSLGLSPTMVETVFASLELVKERGTTILLVEQSVTDALQLADRAYVLTVGKVTESGPAASFESDVDIVAAYFGLES